jgi:hypothetical protein
MQDDENVIIDTPIDTEETVETPTTETEVDVEQVQATNKRLFERAKKAEAELKALKQGNLPKPEAKPQANAPLIDVDERILKANGMPDELLSELRVIAALRGVSVIDAQNDHLFVATKEKFDKDSKSKAASMGASRGSGQIKVQKTFASTGLSREEHMAMIKEADIKL